MDSGRTPLEAQMLDIGRRAREAAATVRNAPPEARSAALTAIAAALRARKNEILAANAKDVAKAKKDGMAEPMIDRLALDEKRLEGVARAVDETAALSDPVGAIMAAWERPQRPQIRARAYAHRRDRRDLREPPERSGGRWRALPARGQYGDPARRLGLAQFRRRDRRSPARRPARRRPARRRHPDCSHDGPRGRGHDARRPWRRH